MNDQDMEYLGNINTSPGSNAGRSIDPTKPGPDGILPREHKMTDEERQKLCNTLRSPNWFHGPEADKAREAADEIERLAALAQSEK